MSIKALGRQSLIYGFGHILTRTITFLLLPLYTHVFSQEEYGVISLAYAFIGFAMILYKYGMDTALMKFSTQQKLNLRKSYINVILIFQLITSCFFSISIYLLSSQLSPWILGNNNSDLVGYLSIILFFDSMWNLPMILLRANEKPIPYVALSILNVILAMALNIFFVLNWTGSKV